MTSSFHELERRFPISASVVALLGCVLAGACALDRSDVVDTTLVDDPRGKVFLQKVDDGWFRTAHPLILNPGVLTTVLRGVRVQASPTDTATGDRVFSDEDTEFLSPLISKALSKAAKSQVVGFDLIRGTDAGNEATGGIVYIQGRLLHLTFTHFRAHQEQVGQGRTPRRLVPNPTGLVARQVSFIPETAKRSSRNEQPDVINTPPLASLVIDYEELSVGLAPPPTPADETDAVQEPVRENKTEVESLKEEMRRLQRRLDDLDRTGPRPITP